MLLRQVARLGLKVEYRKRVDSYFEVGGSDGEMAGVVLSELTECLGKSQVSFPELLGRL